MKGVPWCAKLPLVTVPQGATPKPLTVVMPYYVNPIFLRRQLAWMSTFPPDVRRMLTVHLVDDGSPVSQAEHEIAGPEVPFALRLFRIDTDVRWNWLAARNIGMHHAAEGWCLLTDIDHVIPESTATAVVYGEHDPAVIYGFSRIEHTGETLVAHCNSWLMTRAMFWKVGGYDEALSGHYGTDGEWRRRCAATAPIQILTDRLIRHEHVEDSSTRLYLRKQPQDAAVKRIVAARGKGWRPKTLSFAYHEVLAHEEVAS